MRGYRSKRIPRLMRRFDHGSGGVSMLVGKRSKEANKSTPVGSLDIINVLTKLIRDSKSYKKTFKWYIFFFTFYKMQYIHC